jgi:peptide chain release factor subunit 1
MTRPCVEIAAAVASARRSKVGIAVVQRLSRYDTRGLPVLSVYLDLDTARFALPGSRERELRALLAHARRDAQTMGASIDADVDWVLALFQEDRTLVRGARALAIFSAADAGLLEVVRVRTPIEPMAIVDDGPWIEPLAAVLAPHGWGVAVVGRRVARLFRGGPEALAEFAAIDDEVHGRHAQGGWSQARFQRGIEEQVHAHVRRVAQRLRRAHRRRPFDRLVIVASNKLWPLVEADLPAELRERVAGVVDADLDHASAGRVLQAVAPVLERAEREDERELMVRLEEGLATGGRAAAGLDEVLSTLEEHRVATLLVTASADMDDVELAVELASEQGAEVVVVRHEAPALLEHGGVAALLRW